MKKVTVAWLVTMLVISIPKTIEHGLIRFNMFIIDDCLF